MESFKEILLQFVADPGKIFEDEGILEYLKTQEFEGDIAPYDDFLESLNTCEMSVLRPYADFYKKGGTYYHLTQRNADVIEELGSKITKKGNVAKHFPNVKEVAPTAIECVRNDLNYAIKNAKCLFKAGR